MSRRPELLFNPAPPRQEEWTARLFFDRGAELDAAVRDLDTEHFGPQIYAVYGPSRSGKSHFVLRVLEELVDRFVTVAVNANTQGSCRSVLEEAFFALLRELDAVADEAGGLPGPDLDALRRYFWSAAPLVEGKVAHRDVEVTRELLESLGAS